MSDASPLKVPPHSLDAERSVLGGLMLDDAAWETISGLVSERDFYRSEHRAIYRCMEGLAASTQPLDIVTVSESLEAAGELENVGGLAYVSELANSTPTVTNIKAHAEIVRERATVRNLIKVAYEIAESGFNPGGRDSATLLNEAEASVFKIGDERSNDIGPRKVEPLAASTMQRIQELFDSKEPLTGLGTGFTKIDEMTLGLQPADLVIVAGRPSMGKTAFMMNIAEYVVVQQDKTALVFSMEMPAESLVQRMLASMARVNQQNVRKGDLRTPDWPRLTSAISLLHGKKLLIDDSSALSPGEIRSRARRVARAEGSLDLIVVDYMQLMQVPGNSENRATEIAEISRSLKAIAKEFNCPLIAGSQLNRGLESRTDRRPMMSDLRESGAIEQDADVIFAIHRESVHNTEADPGEADILILKQRNGPIGLCKLGFLPQFTRFEDRQNVVQNYDESYQQQ